MNKKITSSDIAAWMREQLSETHQKHEYASITIEVSAYVKQENPIVRFRLYVGNGYDTSIGDSIEECYDHLATQKPRTKAQQLRDEAAKLIAQAESIESKPS
jgi:hypothetical protein